MPASEPRAASRQPNILILFVDQMQAEVLAPDHPCRTPNLDRLAGEGVRFTRAFCPSPHCCPSRATFMSGLYPTRHGVFNNVNTRGAFQKGLNPGVRLFSEYLREAGYHLAHAGKWHVSDEETPADRGWEELTPYRKHTADAGADKSRGWRLRAADTLAAPRRPGHVLRPGWPDAAAYGPLLEGPTAFENAPYYRSAIAPALRAIPALAKRGGPWALCVSTDMGPSSAVPKALADLYDPDTIPLPPSFGDTMADKPRVYQRMRQQLWGQLTMDEVRRSIAQYWALCSLQDHYLGQLLAALDATGQADDTLVLFVGDHGDCNFAHGLSHMGIPAFRENYHVPAVARWPRGIARPGRVVEEFVTLADFAPTFIELAGRAPTQRLTGRSLAPFLRGETPADWPDAWFSQTKGNEVYYTQRAVQTKRYKYVCNWFDFDELYDLEADPHEMTNLAFPDRAPQPEIFRDAAPGAPLGQPWPRLPDDLDRVRRELLARIWEFADREEDIIFNPYVVVALAPYGPAIRFERSQERETQ